MNDFSQILIRPIVTEKMTLLQEESNKYAFEVPLNVNKIEIKKAVESYFSVEVKEVTVLKVKGKNKRSRFRIKKKSDWKKAYVSLAEGQTIDMGGE